MPENEPEEQWVELYNKGDQPVDLSGWELSDAIDYEIPSGTVLGPGEYLVVSNDAAALSAKYPTIEVVGDFDGNLSRSGERLELLDLRGNPVDTVDYRDGGRWDGLADSGGSSLELRDPHADNAVPESWHSSDESADAPWQTITYRGRATSTFGPTQWNEFVLGLLGSGEVLLDDISVVEDPDGAARQVIQNGTFEADTVGSSASTWRIIGTHEQSYVQVDPTDPNNHVLRLVATGPTEHMHNQAQTTLRAGGTYITINGNAVYEISLRAKWLSGSDLLNTRLYFNRLPATTPLLTTTTWGTPGQQNSRFVSNIGPTYSGLSHGPTVPAPDQDVLVSVTAADPDGITSMRVVYAVNG
ncbi:MAG: lamin tail domain-containing protein, partial [Planctomycetales bacterium]|nr:lamin tail domain-containing protein [Planctomycetales bacterium]